MDKYTVKRFFKKEGKRPKIIMKNVSLEIAKLHCNSPLTEGKGWFDGFVKQ